MSIPASQIVKINPRVLQAGGRDLVMNGLFLTKNNLIPTSSIAMSFATADDVGAFFGTASDEYKVANVYFAGYNNSFKKPRNVIFGRRVDEAASAFIRGGALSGSTATLLDTFKAITAGTLTLLIGTDTIAATGIDFSAATSLSDVASILTTALNGGDDDPTVTYSSLTKAFTITSGSTGASALAGYATGTVAEPMKLTQASGAVLSQGSDALDVTANLAAVRAVTENWATFTNLYSASDAEMLNLSDWASSQGTEYLYVCWSQDAQLLSQSDSTSIAVQLKDAQAGATTLMYGDVTYAAFIMGCAASIDWERVQGTINFAFKSQDGIAANVENATQASTLLAKRCNFYGNYATRNDNFVWLYNASMFGDYNFIDPFVNAIWLNNAMQVACMTGFENSPRVPYNEDGYTQVRAWLMDPINRARKNGVIDAGVVLSEAQKAEVIREAGLDITSNLENEGFYLQVTDAGAAVRVTRDSPNCNLWYVSGGSINRLEIASTLLL